MPEPVVDPQFEALYVAAAAFYCAYAASELALPRHRRLPLLAGVVAHALALVLRGRAIQFFPLTNKFESFFAFALAVFAVALGVSRRAARLHRVGLLVVGGTFYGLTLLFERGVFYPPPLMMTIWYPLHVPASFLAYALWVSAAAAAVAALTGRAGSATRQAVDSHSFWGWCLFSLSMLCGGAWGYVAWGAYFLWDPKVVWSVVLWLFYSGFVHLRHWPAGNRPKRRCGLALVGVALMLVAYVGTSFLFQHGSHSFR